MNRIDGGKRSKKIGFRPGEEDNFRRPRHSADDCLPVRNMKDWGCDGQRIFEPRYADRAYELCSFLSGYQYNKIQGITDEILTPTLIAKQKMHKPAAFSQDMVGATPGRLKKDLTSGRSEDKSPRRDPRRKKR